MTRFCLWKAAVGFETSAGRFVIRNPASVVVYLVWMAAFAAVALYVRGAAPVVLLPLYASAAILFQSRLAHAGYTAAPPVEWPESPAAEAIANRR